MLAGKPYDPENYDEMLVNGVKVHVYKGAVSATGVIKVIPANDWRVPSNLQVEGLLYEQPLAGPLRTS